MPVLLEKILGLLALGNISDRCLNQYSPMFFRHFGQENFGGKRRAIEPTVCPFEKMGAFANCRLDHFHGLFRGEAPIRLPFWRQDPRAMGENLNMLCLEHPGHSNICGSKSPRGRFDGHHGIVRKLKNPSVTLFAGLKSRLRFLLLSDIAKAPHAPYGFAVHKLRVRITFKNSPVLEFQNVKTFLPGMLVKLIYF